MKQVRIVVLKEFKDLQDKNHIYQPGENYPFKGPTDPIRVKELASDENKLGEPLLEVIEDEVDFTILGITHQVIEEPKEERKEEVTPTKKETKKKVVEADE